MEKEGEIAETLTMHAELLLDPHLLGFFRAERDEIIKKMKLMAEYQQKKAEHVDITALIRNTLEVWMKNKEILLAYGRYIKFIKKLKKRPIKFDSFKIVRHYSCAWKRFLHIEKHKIDIGCTVVDSTGRQFRVTGITPSLEITLNNGGKVCPMSYGIPGYELPPSLL